MTIICLEGTSAVGKSTTCRAFADEYNAYIVEETHFLFGSSSLQGLERLNWQLDCQIRRWQIAANKNKQFDHVLLDGDIFKFWYDWVYGLNIERFEYEAAYYRNKLAAAELAFPDCYLVLWADEQELRMRKEGDLSRKRGNFDKHLLLAAPQIKYFNALNTLVPHYAGIHKSETVQSNITALSNQITLSAGISPSQYLPMFDFMIDYLRSTSPI